MAAQYELLKELLNSGTKLNFGQEFFFKFYQAFLLKDRWMQYISGVGTTLLVTALALALGVVLGLSLIHISKPLVASLAAEKGILVSVLSADTRDLSGQCYGSMLLKLPAELAVAQQRCV